MININTFEHYSEEDYILCLTSRYCYVLSQISRYCSITFSVTVQSADSFLFYRNLDLNVTGNIETLSWEIRILPWICYTYDEWMNMKHSLCWRCLHWCFSPHIPMIWHHDNVVRQRRSRAILLSSQCSDRTSCIRHLVSDRRLSLILKENVHNVR